MNTYQLFCKIVTDETTSIIRIMKIEAVFLYQSRTIRKTVATILSLEMTVVLLVFGHSNPVAASEADLILYNGKIVTIDSDFSIRQAIAIKGNKILQVGNNEDILRLKADKIEVLNLDGKTVLPGLIDSHVHATDACMTEFDHPIPQMDSIEDDLSYFRKRADVLEDGE